MAYYYPNTFYPQYPYNSYQQNQNNGMQMKSLEWVEGEVGAKAFQMPQGWPAETPIALWDSTDKKIFLKSWNAMGMAKPLQELDYEIKETPVLLEGNSGHGPDMSQYVTKEDFEELKREIKNMMAGTTTSKSRGGNQ